MTTAEEINKAADEINKAADETIAAVCGGADEKKNSPGRQIKQ
jgi:hypothetical protein